MLYKTGEGAPVVTQKEETEPSAEDDDDDDVLDMDDFEAQGLTLEVEDSVSDLTCTFFMCFIQFILHSYFLNGCNLN